MFHRLRDTIWAYRLPLLCLLAFAVHGPSLRAGFVYDDAWTIVHNSAIRDFSRLPAYFDGRAVKERLPDAWRPLMVLTEMVDYKLFGARPKGYHLQSVLWHVGCVLMVWLLWRRLYGDGLPALLAGVIFAVHPLHTEVVAAINYREDLLATFFTLAALALLVRPAPDPGGRGSFDVSARAEWGAALLVAVGALAKGSALVAPGLYLVIRLVNDPRPFGERLRRSLRPTSALLVAVLAFVAWRTATAGGIDPYAAGAAADRATGGHGWLLGLPSYAEAFWRTAVKLVVPVGLGPVYEEQVRTWSSAVGVASVAGQLALLVLGLWLARRGARREATGILFLLVAWVPVSGIIDLPNLRADRYAYLPSAGFVLLAGHLLAALAPRVRLPAAAIVAGIFSLLTLVQQRAWHDEISLWRAATRTAPGSVDAWAALGRALRLRGEFEEAGVALKRAIELDTAQESGDTRLFLANVLAAQGRYELAIKYYRRASLIGVRFPAHLFTSWGWALHLSGKSATAEEVLRRALKWDPGLAVAHFDLARVLAAQGRLPEAVAAARRAVALAPQRPHYRAVLADLEAGRVPPLPGGASTPPAPASLPAAPPAP